ncbi:MAG: 50S ribosomal protein L32 [Candidatus Gracilibacteria bacterium]|jgi:large subunit ribosomal protein L32
MAKHPVPKKKTSKGRSSRRYKSYANKTRAKIIEGIRLVKCPSCGESVRMHHLCTACGKYRGRQIINKKKEMEKKITKIKA